MKDPKNRDPTSLDRANELAEAERVKPQRTAYGQYLARLTAQMREYDAVIYPRVTSPSI